MCQTMLNADFDILVLSFASCWSYSFSTLMLLVDRKGIMPVKCLLQEFQDTWPYLYYLQTSSPVNWTMLLLYGGHFHFSVVVQFACSFSAWSQLVVKQVWQVLRTRKVAPSGEKSKTVDLSGMMSRMCMLSFVTFRCVLTKP